MFTRRTVLVSVPATLLAPALARAASLAEPIPWSTGTERPKLFVPPGATDCHHHIYDGRFPVLPGTTKPADATAVDYLKLQKRLGLSRHVAVQPSAYGVDNSCLLDALKIFGKSARGIAVVNTDVTDAELKRLHAGGVRGIRFNFAPAGTTTPEMMVPLSHRIARLGWHVQLHAPADTILQLADLYPQLACPLVIDHMAHVPEPEGVKHPVFALALKLLAGGKTWVKLSAPYADTKIGAPSYADVSVVAAAYVKAAPGRVLWGSDWPHPSEAADHKPDDAAVFDLLAQWAPGAPLRHRILVENPARLYGFA